MVYNLYMNRNILIKIVPVTLFFILGYFVFKPIYYSYWHRKYTELYNQKSAEFQLASKELEDLYTNMDSCRNNMDRKKDALLPRYREILLKQSKGISITAEEEIVLDTYEKVKRVSEGLYNDTTDFWDSENKNVKLPFNLSDYLNIRYYNVKSYNKTNLVFSDDIQYRIRDIKSNAWKRYNDLHCPNITNVDVTLANRKTLCKEFALHVSNTNYLPEESEFSIYEEYLIALRGYREQTQRDLEICDIRYPFN